VAPRVLATDADERVLVLEYLADRPPGVDWMTGWGEALARLHATGTASQDLRASGASGLSGAADALAVWAGPSARDVGAFLTLARALGVMVPPGAERELESLVERLARAPGQALLHGDPCPAG
jgi:fructosamine-3-kinase